MTHKVLAYVVRGEIGDRHLLVFEHAHLPMAGLQVPAGTVEPGESLEGALWRELQEESGLQPSQVTLIGKLAEALQPEGDVVRHVYLLAAAAGLPPTWQQVVAGEGDDQGMLFEYRWDPIAHLPRLAGSQDHWLALIESTLSQAQARS